ncbi:Gfo/Idh/MocA family oxidoreductase [candidate division WOR-3 bacterium]|nr:Gfo/Idh/MocA family oxidoreductase [candidate division WOR-3 bacterium]
MNDIRTGVIGVGHLGRHHARIYKQLGCLEGVYDLNQDRMNEVAAEFSCKPYPDMNELIKKVDAVSLATTASTHHTIGMKVLDNKKHLLVEKPVTVLTSHAEEMIRSASKGGVVLQVGHSERFNPAFLYVKDKIRDPFFIESHRIGFPSERGLDVAVVFDLMIHDIDIALQYIKSPIKEISAIGGPIFSREIDIANARVEFENGAIANLMVSRAAQKSKRKIRFFQMDAYISLDFQERIVEIYKRTLENGKYSISVDKSEQKEGEPLMLEISSFINSVKEGKKPEVSGEDGMRSLEVAWKIIEKIKTRYSSMIGFYAQDTHSNR